MPAFGPPAPAVPRVGADRARTGFSLGRRRGEYEVNDVAGRARPHLPPAANPYSASLVASVYAMTAASSRRKASRRVRAEVARGVDRHRARDVAGHPRRKRPEVAVHGVVEADERVVHNRPADVRPPPPSWSGRPRTSSRPCSRRLTDRDLQALVGLVDVADEPVGARDARAAPDRAGAVDRGDGGRLGGGRAARPSPNVGAEGAGEETGGWTAGPTGRAHGCLLSENSGYVRPDAASRARKF